MLHNLHSGYLCNICYRIYIAWKNFMIMGYVWENLHGRTYMYTLCYIIYYASYGTALHEFPLIYPNMLNLPSEMIPRVTIIFPSCPNISQIYLITSRLDEFVSHPWEGDPKALGAQNGVMLWITMRALKRDSQNISWCLAWLININNH